MSSDRGVKKGPNKGRPGRPLLLTDELSAIICGHIEEGVPIKYAAQMAGVKYPTVNEWESRGRDPNETNAVFARFADAMAVARAKQASRLVKAIEDAGHIPNEKTGQRDWRAHAWLLERGHRDDFGPKSKTEVSGPGGGPVFDLGALVGAAADRLTQIESGEIDPEKDD